MSEDSAAPYQVVARRFRPRSFDQVVGQEAILRSLRSALQARRIPHAFLFSGSRGVGKTTTARILARALNCEQGPTPEPCGTCTPCRGILEGSNADVVEIDAASHNLVEDVRALRDSVGFASMGSRYKVYILDEVHMLTRSAFNAFLKTLEEPPSRVVFVLATTELHKVPDTIRSRCQVLLFGRVSEADIRDRLRKIADQEQVALDDAVLEEIAASCRGGMRDAETQLERILPVARELGEGFDVATFRRLVHRVGTDRTGEIVGCLLRGEVGPALHFAAELGRSGLDEREALGEILATLRSLLVMRLDGPDTALVDAEGEHRERLRALAEDVPEHRLDAMIQAGLQGRERLRRLEDRGLVLETCLLHMARAGRLEALGDLVERLRNGGIAADPPAPVTASPAAPAAAAPAGGGGDLRARLLARLREEKPLLARTLELCRVEGPDDAGAVVLALDSDRRMHRDRLMADEVQRGLAAMLGELAGRQVSLQVRAGGEAATRERAPRARRGDEPGPAVRRAAERFDGQVVDLDDDRVS